MQPTYTNQPVNTVRSRGKAGSPPVGVLVFMTIVLASMFFVRGMLPDGGAADENVPEKEAAYVYGEFSEDTENSEDSEDTEDSETAEQTSSAGGGEIAKSAAYTVSAARVNEKPVSVFPLNGEITSYFGTREDPFGSGAVETHLGIDIAGGDEIYACADGQVEKVGESDSCGKYIIIRHNDRIESFYAHCETIYVSEGDNVSAGDTIAKPGDTGNTTGVHLHFEIRLNGNRVDPLDYVVKREERKEKREVSGS